VIPVFPVGPVPGVVLPVALSTHRHSPLVAAMDNLTKQALARAKLRQDPKTMLALEKMGISFESAAREMADLITDGESKSSSKREPRHHAEAEDGTAVEAGSLPNAVLEVLANGPMLKRDLIARLKTAYPPYNDFSDPYKTLSNALVRLKKLDKITNTGDRKPRLIELVQGA
jgi:hypothetical protein